MTPLLKIRVLTLLTIPTPVLSGSGSKGLLNNGNYCELHLSYYRLGNNNTPWFDANNTNIQEIVNTCTNEIKKYIVIF